MEFNFGDGSATMKAPSGNDNLAGKYQIPGEYIVSGKQHLSQLLYSTILNIFKCWKILLMEFKITRNRKYMIL